MDEGHRKHESERGEAALDHYERSPGEWEEVPPPVARQESVARLGATISVRFDPEIADRLRAAGRRLGVPYASLVRRFVEERLAELEGQPLPERFHRRLVLDVEVSPATGEVTIVPGAA
ncbi:MAG: hypothetical protein ACR2NA_12590 [Solirubrobacterales bacterium]|jgi:predicted DNA-binding protein